MPCHEPMQMGGLSSTPHNNAVHYYVRNSVTKLQFTSIVKRLLITDFYSKSGVRHGEGQSIFGASNWQFGDELHAEVLFWHASGPITRLWILMSCLEIC
jgi:hypothetical protein